MLEDEGNGIKKSPRVNLSPGFAYRYIFKNKRSVYSGVRFKLYPENISFNVNSGTFTGYGKIAIQVPLQLRYQFNVYKDRLFISPLVAALFNVFLVGETGGNSMGSIWNRADSIHYSAATKTIRQTFMMASLGLAVEYKFTHRFGMQVFGQYHKGFSSVSRQDIIYQQNQDPLRKAVQNSYGDYATYLGGRLFFNLVKRTESTAK